MVMPKNVTTKTGPTTTLIILGPLVVMTEVKTVSAYCLARSFLVLSKEDGCFHPCRRRVLPSLIFLHDFAVLIHSLFPIPRRLSLKKIRHDKSERVRKSQTLKNIMQLKFAQCTI